MSHNIGNHTTHPAPRFEPHLDHPEGEASGPCRSRAALTPRAGTREENDSAARHCTRHTGQRRRPPATEAPEPVEFAQHAVRTALEVVDGRRPATALRRLAAPTVVAAVTTLARTSQAERRLGPAVLVRLNIAVVDPGAVEVFGGYERGPRRFALAGRLGCARGRWCLAALRLR